MNIPALSVITRNILYLMWLKHNWKTHFKTFDSNLQHTCPRETLWFWMRYVVATNILAAIAMGGTTKHWTLYTCSCFVSGYFSHLLMAHNCPKPLNVWNSNRQVGSSDLGYWHRYKGWTEAPMPLFDPNLLCTTTHYRQWLDLLASKFDLFTLISELVICLLLGVTVSSRVAPLWPVLPWITGNDLT